MFRADLDTIVVGQRLRPLDEGAVSRLETSLAEMGLRQPITIRIGEDGVPALVAGHHRLAAAKRLGWSSIECVEIDNDAIKAEMWEIAENLHRCDLTKEQRDEHIRRYAELIEAQEAAAKVSGQVVQKLGAGRPKETAARVAEATGLSQRTVRRALVPKPARRRPTEAGKQLANLRKAWRDASQAVRDHFLAEVTERAAA